MSTAADRILVVALNGQPIVSNVQYHPFGAPKSWTYGNGQAFTRTFDADGRIAGHTLGADTRTITYDAASRITATTHSNATLDQSFGYDNRDRLTSWVAYATNQSYAYDAGGNRTSHTMGANTYTHSVAANSNRLMSVSGPAAKSYSYDAAGNLTAAGMVTVTYGGDGRPATMGYALATTSSNGLGQRIRPPSTSAAILAFDENGRILGEYLTYTGTARTETVYLGAIPVAVLRPPQIVLDSDTAGNLLVITGTWPLSTSGAGYTGTQGYRTHAAGSGAASVRWRFWYSGSNPAAGSYNVFARWVAGADRAINATYAITHAGGTSTVTANQQVNGGEWVALGAYSFAQDQAHGVVLTDQADGLVVADAIKYENANLPFYTYYVHPDHLNTPRVVIDSANQMRWRWDAADPFGALEPTDVIGAVTFKMNDRFPGQYAETYSHSWFFYNYFRDYDPATGRFIQSDPIGLAGGLNTYAYVYGDPLRFSDPKGLDTYICTRPLRGSGGLTPGPAFHQYVCTWNDYTGQIVCGSITPTGGIFGSPSRLTGPNDDDVYDPTRCRLVAPPNDCLETCIAGRLRGNLPEYDVRANVGRGRPDAQECQTFSNNVLSSCRQQCGLQ